MGLAPRATWLGRTSARDCQWFSCHLPKFPGMPEVAAVVVVALDELADCTWLAVFSGGSGGGWFAWINCRIHSCWAGENTGSWGSGERDMDGDKVDEIHDK